jgi:predicted AlkP superfamily phosphohydrolase/phosphomutase
MTEGPKVLVILLDAFDADLLLRWVEEGRLPALGALLGSALRATTLAPFGMHSGAAWSTLSTGASPARHARHAHRQIRSGTYTTYRALPSEVRAEPFWEPIARAGRRVAVIDVPDSRLARGLNGVQVVDWLSHTSDSGFQTSPAALGREIVARFGEERLGLCDHAPLSSLAELRRFRDGLIERARRKAALSCHLLAREAWDLFVTVFSESHCIGHRCWHLHDPAHPRHDARQAEELGDPLEAVYRAIDAGVGELLTQAGNETTVLLVSNLGMGPNYNGAHLLDDVLFRLGHAPPPPPAKAAWRALRHGWRRLPLAWRGALRGVAEAAVDRTWPPFDPRRSCFSVANGEVFGGLRVNLAGREPAGGVQPGAHYEETCARLAGEFLALQNADTGEPAVLRVVRTADVHAGPHLDALPDLLIEWNTAAPLDAVRSPKTGTIRKPYRGPRTGHHRREGILLCRAAGVQRDALDEPVSLADVAPTIAALLGVSLDGVDGRPIARCLPGAPSVPVRLAR